MKKLQTFTHLIIYACQKNRRFKSFENKILKYYNEYIIFDYSYEVIKGRWKEAESILFKNNKLSFWYIFDVIKVEHPKITKKVINYSFFRYDMDNFNYSIGYAKILNRRLKKIENKIGGKNYLKLILKFNHE